ncbi:MAG TPA: hypothetical protein VIM88_02950 [Sulfurovum sp.]|uniref:hypothetical protein n=1 Tax=Sulfurovum sp. TaxID=1969726 RepID=UPI002F92805A
MKKEFKALISESQKSLEKAEEKIESFSEDLSEDATVFWLDLKKRLSRVKGKLEDAYDHFEEEAELKAHLGVMEARDQIEKLKGTMDNFTHKVSNGLQEELDIAALRAHLAKMESEDLWSEKQKDLTQMYDRSKDEVQKLAKRSLEEMNQLFLKLTELR